MGDRRRDVLGFLVGGEVMKRQFFYTRFILCLSVFALPACVGGGPVRRAQTIQDGQWRVGAVAGVTGTTVERAADVILPEGRIDAAFGASDDLSLLASATVVPVGAGLWGLELGVQHQYQWPRYTSITFATSAIIGARQGAYGGLNGQLFLASVPLMMDIRLASWLTLTPSMAPGYTMMRSPGAATVHAMTMDGALGVHAHLTKQLTLQLEARTLHSPTTLEGENGAWLGHVRFGVSWVL